MSVGNILNFNIRILQVDPSITNLLPTENEVAARMYFNPLPYRGLKQPDIFILYRKFLKKNDLASGSFPTYLYDTTNWHAAFDTNVG